MTKPTKLAKEGDLVLNNNLISGKSCGYNWQNKSLWTKKIIILDGAFGTELQKKDCPRCLPEKLCLDNPQIMQGLYASYQKAGAQIVYTCTFGANRFKLKQYGVKENLIK